MNIHVPVFVWTCLHFFEVNAQEWNSGSYGSCIFSFWRHCQPVFQGDSTILYSHQQYMSDSVTPYFYQHLVSYSLFSPFCNIISHCIYLMASDVKHLLMCLFAICRFFSMKCRFMAIVPVLRELFVYQVFRFEISVSLHVYV